MTEPFDPSRLVAAAQAQRPDLAAALARCTAGRRESRAYVHFVDPSGPEWIVVETVRLDDRRLGTVAVDVLRDGRIGGVEFLRHV